MVVVVSGGVRRQCAGHEAYNKLGKRKAGRGNIIHVFLPLLVSVARMKRSKYWREGDGSGGWWSEGSKMALWV